MSHQTSSSKNPIEEIIFQSASFSEVQTLEQLECKNILFRDYGTSMRGINHRPGFNYINLSDLGEAGNVPGLSNFRMQSFINLGFTKNGLGFCLESLLQVRTFEIIYSKSKLTSKCKNTCYCLTSLQFRSRQPFSGWFVCFLVYIQQ